MSDLSQVGMENALSRFSRRTTIGDWIVASGSTTTVLNVTKSDGTAVDLSANVVNDLTNSMISFEAPGVNEGEYRHIASITDTGTITLDKALSKTPVTGDPFTILTLMSVDVTASDNISQWGGAAVKPADASGVVYEQQAYTEGAAGSAVPSHTLQVGGSDGTDLRALATDATGAVKLAAGTNNIGSVSEASIDASTGTAGTAVPAKTIQVGGTDGTDLRALSTDSSGRLVLGASTQAIGAVTEASIDESTGTPASAAPTNAIQVGGTDGTDLRALSTTATGKLALAANVVSITNVSEAASTAFGGFTAPHTGTAKILVASSAAATLSFTGAGQTNALGSLTASTWAQYDVPVIGGQTYSFQVSAAGDVSLIVNVSTD